MFLPVEVHPPFLTVVVKIENNRNVYYCGVLYFKVKEPLTLFSWFFLRLTVWTQCVGGVVVLLPVGGTQFTSRVLSLSPLPSPLYTRCRNGPPFHRKELVFIRVVCFGIA